MSKKVTRNTELIEIVTKFLASRLKAHFFVMLSDESRVC